MSKETKETVETIKKYFEQVQEGGKQLTEKAGFDKDLSKKIQKVQEGAKEVVEHIKEKQK